MKGRAARVYGWCRKSLGCSIAEAAAFAETAASLAVSLAASLMDLDAMINEALN
jgi:hypothetical protein